MINRLLLAIVSLLLSTNLAFATITFDSNEVRSTASTHWSDSTHTMSWVTAPTGNTQIIYVCGLVTTILVDFVTPTATNVTFSSIAVIDIDGTTDVTLQCWYGVASGTVGDVALTTSGTTASVGIMRMGSFTTTTGWTAPTGATVCQSPTSSSTTHDADCSGLTTTASVSSVIIGYTAVTSSGATMTVDTSSYTELTRVAAQQEIAAYRIVTGETTVTWQGISSVNKDSGNVQFAFDENAAGGGAVNRSLLMGVGK